MTAADWNFETFSRGKSNTSKILLIIHRNHAPLRSMNDNAKEALHYLYLVYYLACCEAADREQTCSKVDTSPSMDRAMIPPPFIVITTPYDHTKVTTPTPCRVSYLAAVGMLRCEVCQVRPWAGAQLASNLPPVLTRSCRGCSSMAPAQLRDA